MESKKKQLTMLLVGDVFVQRDDPPSVFKYVGDFLKSGDFTLGNLEGSTSDSGAPWSIKETNWRADARQVTALSAAGFDAVTVANNHMLDFGHDALRETLGHLDRLGIKHTGGGENFAEAHRPAIVEKHGCRIALLGYTSVFIPEWAAGPDTPGLAVMRARTSYEAPRRVFEVPGTPPIVRTRLFEEDREQLAADIAAARRGADIVVCAFHWGVSRGYREIAEYQVELGRHAVDVGADLVVGSHPHVLQGIEVYKGRAIFYSLGNFTFAQQNLKKGHENETMIVRCLIEDKRICAVEYIPARMDGEINPHALDLTCGADVVDLVAQRSARFQTRFTPHGDAVRLAGAGAA
ncbi:CapA family protein [Ancylobacter sp. MQZ15Z-1]|uniref:CapA family protein n=1 Tax=Ancylobacter mangrovi TaxID=2972472 RepID=A0A9X2PHI4_9HYPH|nr:CapA family protein [Ancylobacter mangrovi]MCS0497191.1 CapA family protein [Ancylobacter mangrovi]